MVGTQLLPGPNEALLSGKTGAKHTWVGILSWWLPVVWFLQEYSGFLKLWFPH